MNLIEHATHAENTIAQLTSRIDTLAAELTAAKAAFDEKAAYQAAMESRVSAVLQSGDPLQYEALARDFLTPAEAKARQEKLAQLESLKAQAAALELELTV